MARAKERVDDLTALRQATREAHEAVQSLNEARKACEVERARLEAVRQDLADMMVAIWDGKMASTIDAALDNYLPTVAHMISATEEKVAERINTLVEMVMNPQEYDVARIIEEQYGTNEDTNISAIEALVLNAVGVVNERKGGLG